MRYVLLTTLFILSWQVSAKSAEQLRAAYLMQFPLFVKYSDSLNKPSKLTYCFAEQLGSVGRLIEDKKLTLKKRLDFDLVIVKKDEPERLNECSYLYIAKEIKDQPFYLVNATKQTITVGEELATLKAGSFMALVQEQNKVKIHINGTRLRENIVSFNARLLGLSQVTDY